MTPRHHPGEELLLAYSGGSLSEGMSLVIATHLALCPQCRANARAFEEIGGLMLETLPPAPLDPRALERTMALIRQREDDASMPARPLAAFASPIPRPLSDYIGDDLSAIRWRGLPGKPQYLRIDTNDSNPEVRVRLFSAPPGKPIPEHDHDGTELTLVLQGAFKDGDTVFRRGDCALQQPGAAHSPVAVEGRPCICLLARDGQLRYTSVAMRLFQRFMDV